MIGDMYTPPMYRDVISSGMFNYEIDPTLYGMGTLCGGMYDPTMMGLGGYYNTNYLGGLKMQPILNRDTLHIIRQKEHESLNTVKTIGLAVLGIAALGFVSTLFKGKLKTKIPAGCPGLNPSSGNWFTNFLAKFKKKP